MHIDLVAWGWGFLGLGATIVLGILPFIVRTLPLRVSATAMIGGLLFTIAGAVLLVGGVSESHIPDVKDVKTVRYAYDGVWRLVDVASEATALAADETVVATARVVTPFPSGKNENLHGGLDVEETVYGGAGSKSMTDIGTIHFDVYGNVTAFKSNRGRAIPVFKTWPMGQRL